MSFIVGGLIIGGAATLGGAALSADASKSAASKAAKGAEREIAFNRESRDLARGDQAYGRQAGATALDAMMSMTGLGLTNFGATEKGRQYDEKYPSASGSDYLEQFRGRLGNKGKKALSRYQALNPYHSGYDSQEYINNFSSSLGGRNLRRFKAFEQQNPFVEPPRYEDGPVGRAYGGVTGHGAMYNVNELGPENIYRNGSYSRNQNPATINGSTGYVEPHIQGRYMGGSMGSAIMGASRGNIKPAFDRQNVINPNSGFAGPNNAPPNYTTPQENYTTPQENPGGVEGGYNFMTDPGYEFRRSEGERAVSAGASARGGLLSGGTGKALTRYGQDYASNEYTNVYNRISNIAGLGQSAAANSGNAAMQAGAYMGNAASNAGNASAYGAIGAGNAWANAGNQIAQLPWDKIKWGGGGGITGGGGVGRSDMRLKENIVEVGQVNNVHLYTWDWNDTAKEMGIADPSFGVIAQEVRETHPDSVTEDNDGYLMVDYKKIFGE